MKYKNPKKLGTLTLSTKEAIVRVIAHAAIEVIIAIVVFRAKDR